MQFWLVAHAPCRSRGSAALSSGFPHRSKSKSSLMRHKTRASTRGAGNHAKGGPRAGFMRKSPFTLLAMMRAAAVNATKARYHDKDHLLESVR